MTEDNLNNRINELIPYIKTTTHRDYQPYLKKDIDRQTDQLRVAQSKLDIAIESMESLKELSGYYYKRGVPHQTQIDHCLCRECTDKRVDKALIILSQLKDNKDIEV